MIINEQPQKEPGGANPSPGKPAFDENSDFDQNFAKRKRDEEIRKTGDRPDERPEEPQADDSTGTPTASNNSTDTNVNQPRH